MKSGKLSLKISLLIIFIAAFGYNFSDSSIWKNPYIVDIRENHSSREDKDRYGKEVDAGESKAYTDADKLVNNIDVLYKLQDKEWDNIDSMSEKQEILQVVAYVEGRNLGLPLRLKVKVTDLGDTAYLADYSDAEKLIRINENYLKTCSGWDAVECCVHECRHSWQHQIADMYSSLSQEQKSLEEIRKYENIYKELLNGVSKWEYWDSTIETDAREYAVDSRCNYQNNIEEYIQQNGI